MTTELQAKIGTTFTVGAFSVRLDVHDDDYMGTRDDDGLTHTQLKAYQADEWTYVGITAEVSLEGIELGTDSLWGIERGWFPMTDEDDNLTIDPIEYLDVYDEAIQGVIDEAISNARTSLARLVKLASELPAA